MKISYITEPVQDYMKAVDSATSAKELVKNIRPFRLIANDAFLCAETISEEDFAEFKRGLVKERKKEFAGEAWANKYSEIIFPLVMFQVTLTADQFVVPWGVAYLRLQQAGFITVNKSNIATWHDAPAKLESNPQESSAT